MVRAKTYAAAALGAGVLALTGCQSAAGVTADSNVSCDIISSDSQSDMAGTEDVFVSGGHFDKQDRDYISCDVLADGTPDELVRILTYEAEADEARDDAAHARRGQQQTESCTDITMLPEGAGYLCDRADKRQIDASVAMQDRLVRFSFFEGSQLDEVTPSKVQEWAEDVDKQVGALDETYDQPVEKR